MVVVMANVMEAGQRVREHPYLWEVFEFVECRVDADQLRALYGVGFLASRGICI